MSGGVVVAVVVAVVLAAFGVVVLRGRFRAGLRLPGLDMKVAAGRDPIAPPPGPTAEITGSKAGRDMTAAGAGGARIDGSEAVRDMIARAEPGAHDPKA